MIEHVLEERDGTKMVSWDRQNVEDMERDKKYITERGQVLTDTELAKNGLSGRDRQ